MRSTRFHRRRLRLALGGTTRHRRAPRPRGDALSGVCLRRPVAAAVDPIPIDSCAVLPPCLPPAQALRSVEASAMGETRNGSSIGHVEQHLSRFVSEPGLKVIGFSPDPLVPVPEPGQMDLWNRDKWTFFY